MIDVALIELEQLLGCSVDELIALVKPMSADSCEQYARAILGRLGGPSFEQLMMRILQTAAAKGVSPPPSDPDTYYFASASYSPVWPMKVMWLGGSFCSLFLRVHYGWRRTRV
jgi:hypothetical protein